MYLFSFPPTSLKNLTNTVVRIYIKDIGSEGIKDTKEYFKKEILPKLRNNSNEDPISNEECTPPKKTQQSGSHDQITTEDESSDTSPSGKQRLSEAPDISPAAREKVKKDLMTKF